MATKVFTSLRHIAQPSSEGNFDHGVPCARRRVSHLRRTGGSNQPHAEARTLHSKCSTPQLLTSGRWTLSKSGSRRREIRATSNTKMLKETMLSHPTGHRGRRDNVQRQIFGHLDHSRIGRSDCEEISSPTQSSQHVPRAVASFERPQSPNEELGPQPMALLCESHQTRRLHKQSP